MKATIRLTKLVGQPPKTIQTDFITPVRAMNSEDSWSARIYWGRYDSKKCGDLIDLELIVPTARLDVGNLIEIFGGGSFEACAEVIHTRDE